ncbi:MAG: helix-turn-helix domain-containing protein [Candidatus Hydrogenedentes bacterium]|nr:helix-turn-helix domain-containing protein [Candidatus Hydrogenedentota bacterium]
MKKKAKDMTVFEQIKSGLEDGIAYFRGELTLVTTALPAPPPKANPKKIAAIRRKLGMSQSVFAATLNVSMRTVQSWEQGVRRPSDASLRLLQIIGTQPTVVDALFAERPVRAKSRYSRSSRRPRQREQHV